MHKQGADISPSCRFTYKRIVSIIIIRGAAPLENTGKRSEMRITQAEQDARIARVIKVAYQLFCDNSIDKVSIDMVADRAEVSHASISRYFGNKAQLLYHTQQMLWRDLVDKIVRHNKRELDSSKNGYGRLKVLLSGFDFFVKEYSSYIVFAQEYKLFLLRSGIRLTKVQEDAISAPVYSLFYDTIVNGQQDGSISDKYTAASLYSYVWMSMRSLAEMLVVNDRIYESAVSHMQQFKMAQDAILDFVKA